MLSRPAAARRRLTPDRWPAYVWVPLLLALGAIPAGAIIAISALLT